MSDEYEEPETTPTHSERKDDVARDLQAAWLEVARRRSAEIAAGTVECRAAEDVFERARREFPHRR